MAVTTETYKILNEGEGLSRQSLPGQTLSYKVCGSEAGGQFDYVVLSVDPGVGPPAHLHEAQHETTHFLSGRFKVHVANHVQIVDEGGFMWVAPRTAHAFVNVSNQRAMCVQTYSPGYSHHFFAEFGAAVLASGGTPDAETIERTFRHHAWQVVGPPLTRDEP